MGGAPPPSDADFRTEDMFMNGAMLGRAFRLTGETRYLDLLTQFLLAARTQQDDGLFWHARSTPWFWGRRQRLRRAGLFRSADRTCPTTILTARR